jgi:hypothetical protein
MVIALPYLTSAQDCSTADYILDGGKLIVDIFRVSKKGKSEPKTDGKADKIQKKSTSIEESSEEEIKAESSFCFNNKIY